jgi:hypothetical protein
MRLVRNGDFSIFFFFLVFSSRALSIRPYALFLSSFMFYLHASLLFSL